MAERTGGQVLVEALAAHGVDTVFGIPGTHNLAIYAALAETGLRHILLRHEQGVGFAADGYARVAGRPGVCVTTTGPGLLNAATALAQAYSDSVPVLVVSPGMPTGHPATGNGELHEMKNQSAALDSIVAHSHRVESIAEIPVAVARAFATMCSGRPRPVHIEIPFDLLDASGDPPACAPVAVRPLTPPAAELDRAADLLRSARAPGILAGGGVGPDAAPALRVVAERLGAPVVTSMNGKGVLSDDHPLALGAGLAAAPVKDFLASCDLLLAVGTELAPSDMWYGGVPGDVPLVRIDVDPVQVVTNGRPAVAVLGDAGEALAGLLDRLGPPENTGNADDARDGHRRAAHWRDLLRADARTRGGPWLWIVEALESALGRNGVLAGDSTMACYYGALGNLRSHTPGGYLYPTGFGTLGYGLPAGIGAVIAAPDRPVVVLEGDGGFMFTATELAAASALGLPLPVIVVENGGYGEIRRQMKVRGDRVQAVDLPPVDLLGLARSMGCHAHAVPEVSVPELARLLGEALKADRPTVIVVPEAEAVEEAR
ncbi:5-guanidino-2-oxopentanoate decarboxylase [Streptosporangium sp. NPDC004631]